MQLISNKKFVREISLIAEMLNEFPLNAEFAEHQTASEELSDEEVEVFSEAVFKIRIWLKEAEIFLSAHGYIIETPVNKHLDDIKSCIQWWAEDERVAKQDADKALSFIQELKDINQQVERFNKLLYTNNGTQQ